MKKQGTKRLFDFRQNKEDYMRASLSNSMKEIKSSAWALSGIYNVNKSNENNIIKILELVMKTEQKYQMSNFEDMLSCLENIAEITALLKSGRIEKNESIIPKLVDNTKLVDIFIPYLLRSLIM